jgi:hypothetical protein
MMILTMNTRSQGIEALFVECLDVWKIREEAETEVPQHRGRIEGGSRGDLHTAEPEETCLMLLPKVEAPWRMMRRELLEALER